MTEKLNISKHSRRVVKHQSLPIIWLQLDTTSNGIILINSVESLLIKDLKPSLNEDVSSEKLFLYQPLIYFPADFDRSVYYKFFTIVLIRF